jgi:hypothetical protein
MTLTKQCNLLCLNRSSLYIKNKETDIEEVIILKMLSNLYLTHPFYGYRKVSIWLQMQGYKMNKKRVRRYLKLINWRTIYREPRTTIAIKEHKKYPCWSASNVGLIAGSRLRRGPKVGIKHTNARYQIKSISNRPLPPL